MSIFLNLVFIIIAVLGLIFCIWILWLDYSARKESAREKIKKENEKNMKEYMKMRRAG